MKLIEESVYGKYNLFFEQINKFWKRKATKTLGRAYAYTCMRTHAQDLRTHASCMHTHTRACIRIHVHAYTLGFQKL